MIVSPAAERDLERLESVRRSEWNHMRRMIADHPRIGLKVGTTPEGLDIRRVVLIKSKVLVYYVEQQDVLNIVKVQHGSAEKRPFEN